MILDYVSLVYRVTYCIIFISLFLKCAIFTFMRITLLLPLVIISPLHIDNHKKDVGNIGVRDHFLLIWRHFQTWTNPIACISHTPTLGQNLEEKSATYTQVYTVILIVWLHHQTFTIVSSMFYDIYFWSFVGHDLKAKITIM